MSKPSLHRLDAHQVECAKLLRANCSRHRLHTVFADFCELAALSISNSVDRIQHAAREERYLAIVGQYDADEVARFPQMLGCIVLSLEAQMKDCLGQLFMSLELGDHWKGQFFTPYEVSSLMARMIVGAPTAEDLEKAGGFMTLCEPAAGAGGMCIAAAHALQDAGIDFQRQLHVTAIDVDATAAHMAYLQLSLLHIPALVIQGNSLTGEERAHWVTPAHVLGGWDHRLRTRSATESSTTAASTVEVQMAPPAPTDAADRIAATRDQLIVSRLRSEQMSLF